MQDDLWVRLQAHCEAVCPALPRGGLNAPATPHQIETVESLVGVRLPDDLREAYSRFNGMQPRVLDWSAELRALPVLLGQFHWIDLESLVRDWTLDRCIALRHALDDAGDGAAEIEGRPVRPFAADKAWLPVGNSMSDVSALVDLNPSRWGTHGQLLFSDREAGEPRRMASSFGQAVRTTLDALDRGAVVWDGWGLNTPAGHGLPMALEDWQAL